MKAIHIEIPKEIALSLKMKPEMAPKQLKEELAVHLYRQGFLSFEKAMQLAEMTQRDFAKKTGKIRTPSHEPPDELEEDMEVPNRRTNPTVDRAALYRQALSAAGKFKSGQPDIAVNHDRYLEEAFE
jgi:predicted HTH domain antitoxin